MQVVLSAINSKYIHTGLGLRYVGEYAKAQGHEVTLIEETINTPILAVLEKSWLYRHRSTAFLCIYGINHSFLNLYECCANCVRKQQSLLADLR